MRRGFVKILQRSAGPLPGLELPTPATDRMEPIPPLFEDPSSLRRAFLGDQKIEIQLRSQFKPWHGIWPERKALQRSVGKPSILEAGVNCICLRNHLRRAPGIFR